MYQRKSGALLLSLLLATLASGCNKDFKTEKEKEDDKKDLRKMEKAIDAQIDKMMRESGASAVTVAVMRDGKLQYEQAYGYSDATKKIELKKDALLRTASIVKPVTAAAIQQLANDGTISLSDHVYCTGSNAPCWLRASLLAEGYDERIKDVTIKNLVEHQGGFTRESDPQGGEYIVWEDCESYHCPATQEDVVRYMMAQPLDFSPGQKPANLDGYSNYGYMVLGMIIEQASKMSYTRFVQTRIMAPIGVSDSDFKAARSLPKDHDPREPIYISDEQWPSAFTKGKMAPFAEEGTIAENWTSVGFGITTAKTMADFAANYKIPYGERLGKHEKNNAAHWGSLDGSATFLRQLPSGVSYAVLMNRHIEIDTYSGYQDQLDKAAELGPD